tara:strand:+ start:420 stop:725 length:306 start_codon:yes stop_codon:yes gene_type:complete
MQQLTIFQFDNNEYYLNRYEFLNKVQNKVLEFFVDIDKSEDFSFEGSIGDYANEIILGQANLPIENICLLKYNNGKLENIGCEDDTVQVKLSITINESIVE